MSTDGPAGQRNLELRDVLVIKSTEHENELEFEVVGLIEDDAHNPFAVLYCEAEDEFVVTDAEGNLLEDKELAQEVLDDFHVFLQESGGEGAAE